MNFLLSESHAAWLAAHSVTFFLFFPTLAAGVAAVLWQSAAGQPLAQRRIIYWGLILCAALLFAFLATSVVNRGAMVQFDTTLARGVAFSVPSGMLSWLAGFTYLGDRNLLGLFAVFVTLILLYRRRWEAAAVWAAVLAGGGALNWTLKHIFQRVRPELMHGYMTVQGWSFPSGHASSAMAVYGMICYFMLRWLPASWRWAGLFVAVWLITAIGVSRVLLQAHYLSDVVAGFAVTFVWLAVCVVVIERRLHRNTACV